MKLEDLPPDQRAIVDEIHANCEELGSCLIWKGKLTSSGYPKTHIDGQRVLARRYVAALKMERPIGRGEVAASKCNDPLCLAWDCIRVVTQAKRRAETGAAGGYSTREKSLRLSIARRKTAKLEGKEDAANRIRTDPRPSALVAPEYGISPSMVRKIRRNAAWRDISTPFAGLLR